MSPLRLLAALSLCCLAALPVAAAAPQYTLQDLGSLTPGGSAQPQGINQAGQVFGSATPSTTNLSLPGHIFFWSPQGGMIDVGALPENRPAGSYPAEGFRAAVAMNDQGQITGQSEVRASFSSDGQLVSVSHAFLWTPAPDDRSGTIQDLGTLVANSQADIGTTAVAINNHGQVLGTADALTLTPQGYRNIDPPHGFLWTPGGTGGAPSNPQMKDLGLLVPSLLDDSGRVIGLLNGVLTLYDGQNSIPLGDPPGFDPNGLYSGYRFVLLRTDAHGDIYGNFSTPTVSVNPFVWVPDHLGATAGHFVSGTGTDSPVPPPGALTDGQLPASAQVFWASANVSAFNPADTTISAVDLGGLFFDPYSLSNSAFPAFSTYPTALNSSKDLVGTSYLSNGPSGAFLEQAGLMYDLNLHIQAPNAGAFQLWEAVGINDVGQIAAIGQPAGQPASGFHALLLTPAGRAAPAAPTIQLIQPQPPDAGDPDQTVDITGTGFQVGAVVTYDGVPLTATVYAETQIIAHIPSADLTAGTHTVTVTNPDGRAGSGPYVVLPVRPVPTLTSVSPASLPAGSPDTTLTLAGTGLYPETQIAFGYVAPGQTPLTVLSASSDHTRITVRLPAAQMTVGTILTFYAYTPGQRGAAQSTPQPTLTVVNPAPTITSISPPSLVADGLPGFTLTVNGTGFTPSTIVNWGGFNFSTTYVSPTRVTAFISGYSLIASGPDAAAPGLVTVSVTNSAPGGGTAGTTQAITDGPYPVPVLTGISPSSMQPIRSSSSVTLTGGNFMHHSVIHLGSHVFSPESLSDDRTQLTFYLPSSVFLPVGVYPVTVVNPGPGGGTSAALSLTIQGGVTHTHLLWNNGDGRVMLWSVAPGGSFTLNGFGPYTDGASQNKWSATAVATGGDGVSHLLWNNTDGRVMLWTVNDAGSFTLAGYGPYTDGAAQNKWSATAVSVGPDNVMHLLWNNTDGRVMLWNVDPSFNFTLAGFGPYTDNGANNLWSAAAVATGPDNVSRIAWNNTDGRVMLWDVAPDFSFTLAGYGPYTDGAAQNKWSATAVSVGPDNVTHLLWSNTDRRAMLWNVDSSFGFTLAGYGPYTDNAPGNLWSAAALATGPDGLNHLLWANTDYRAMLWGVDSAFNFTVAGYGPYTDNADQNQWSVTAVSAGP